MTAELTILKVTEKHFKVACCDLKIEYICIREGIDGDTFSVKFDSISDIYTLGQMVGGESMIEFHLKNS